MKFHRLPHLVYTVLSAVHVLPIRSAGHVIAHCLDNYDRGGDIVRNLSVRFIDSKKRNKIKAINVQQGIAIDNFTLPWIDAYLPPGAVLPPPVSPHAMPV